MSFGKLLKRLNPLQMERYTIEILIDDNKYIINQFYGAYNKEAPQSLVTELENILKGESI